MTVLFGGTAQTIGQLLADLMSKNLANPVALTSYDPDHPYVVAEYDLPDRG